MWFVLSHHVERVSHNFFLDGEEALGVEDEKVGVVDSVILCPNFLQPEGHLLAFLGEACIQIERGSENLLIVVVLVEQLEVWLQLIRPR